MDWFPYDRDLRHERANEVLLIEDINALIFSRKVLGNKEARATQLKDTIM